MRTKLYETITLIVLMALLAACFYLLLQEIANLNQEITNLNQEITQEITSLNQEIADLKQETTNLNREITNLNREITNFKENSLLTAELQFTLLISQQYPEFVDNQIDDWQKVSILRQWAYQHVDRASESCLLGWKEDFYTNGYLVKSAPELFNMFFQDKGGVWCGGTAYALMKLYELYGFDSYVVGSGRKESLTHVVTVVRISYAGRDILTVQDAYFGVTYVDSTGAPYDYFELLKILENHEHDKVKIVSAGSKDLEAEVILCPGEIPQPADRGVMCDDRVYEQLVCEHISGGRVKCKVHPTLEYFVKNYASVLSFKEFLIQEGHPPELVYAFLYPYDINVMKDDDELFNRAQSIIEGNP